MNDLISNSPVRETVRSCTCGRAHNAAQRLPYRPGTTPYRPLGSGVRLRLSPRINLLVAVVATAAFLTSCSSSATSASTHSSTTSTSTAAVAGTTTELTAATNQNLGTIVTDQSGFTLYRFEKDTTDPPASNCNGQCAETWPPALVGPSGLSGVNLDGVSSSVAGVVTRSDGTKQLTIAGHPVYRYAGDKAPGQTNGQDVGSTWFAITPIGDKAFSDGGAQLNLAQSNSLGAVVTDGDGFTLYRFDKDSNNPPTSNCSGQCAITCQPARRTARESAEPGTPSRRPERRTRPFSARSPKPPPLRAHLSQPATAAATDRVFGTWKYRSASDAMSGGGIGSTTEWSSNRSRRLTNDQPRGERLQLGGRPVRPSSRVRRALRRLARTTRRRPGRE